MTDVATILTRAQRRLQVIDSLHTPSSEEQRDALAAFNEMLYGWKGRGCDLLLQAEFELSDTFQFWVPPAALTAETIGVVAYQGTWNASTNSPTLASADGTEGYVYKVSTAGSTDLDDVTDWALNDYAVFDGTEWLRGERVITLQGAVIACLAARYAGEFGMPVPDDVARDAVSGWGTIQSYYVKPPKAGFDLALRQMPSRTIAVTYEGINE